MKKPHEVILSQLFLSWCGEEAIKIIPLTGTGSYRQYFRISGSSTVLIGAFNADVKENEAFFSFSKSFIDCALPVPEIYIIDSERKYYLLQDLGDETLFSFLVKNNADNNFHQNTYEQYRKVISWLPKFQTQGSNSIDYSKCYPRAAFDKQSMLWDLNYFKYYFLKLAKIQFDEQMLEDDFQTLSNYLLQADGSNFLYRDFQSRNIMLLDNEPYFIDYQGGRKGALQYDIASLLYDAKADLPQNIRLMLLDEYILELEKYMAVDKNKFIEFYYGFVLIRIMQALGAYGFRGFYEKKSHFLQSIPYALNNLRWIIDNISIPVKTPVLSNVLEQLIQSEELYSYGKAENKLSVSISSFSYKQGLPVDNSGNGGGFIFDCRSLHNPGKYEEYKYLTGNDKPVINFLQKEAEVYEFMSHVFSLVDKAIEKYQARKFTHLSVNFGCTGGQHRSVFCANMLASHLKSKFDIQILLAHREIENGTTLKNDA